jgi:hypothetical protein
VQAAMLVLNAYRLHQMLQLVKEVKRSVSGDLSMDWLKPFMTERKCKPGEMLFYKDEKAAGMIRKLWVGIAVAISTRLVRMLNRRSGIIVFMVLVATRKIDANRAPAVPACWAS